tara:strand:+ start:1774 stop:2262 length:489 start_codon:yes stop_codon:yes gene_type:complete
MLVEFTKLDKKSRIWVFQSKNQLDESTYNLIKKKISVFLENWKSHQKSFESSFIIKYKTFVVIAADETNLVSGCSIDSLINFVKSIEDEFEINLLDKLDVKYKIGDDINTANLNEFKKICKNIDINDKLIVFNNLVKNIDDFEKKWEVDIRESWHKRFLTNV